MDAILASKTSVSLDKKIVNGPVVASLLSFTTGLWALLISHHLTIQSQSMEKKIYAIGSWMHTQLIVSGLKFQLCLEQVRYFLAKAQPSRGL
jgi:hypothetical protein